MKKGLFILVSKEQYVDIRSIPKFLDYIIPIYSRGHIHIVHTKKQLEEGSRHYESIDLINFDIVLGYIPTQIDKYILNSDVEYRIQALIGWLVNPKPLNVKEKISLDISSSFREFIHYNYTYIPFIIG